MVGDTTLNDTARLQLLQLAHTLRARHESIEQVLQGMEERLSVQPANSTTVVGREPQGGESLRARLALVRERLDAVVTTVDERLDAVTHRVSAIREEVGGAVRSAGQAHTSLAQHAEATEGSLTGDWAQFRAEAERIGGALAETMEHLHEQREALDESLEAFQEGTAALVGEIARDVDSIADRAEGLLREALRRLHDLRESAAVHIHGTIVDDALGGMEQAVGEMLEALHTLHGGTEDGARSLEQSIAGVGATIRQIVQIVDTIRPILDAVRALS